MRPGHRGLSTFYRLSTTDGKNTESVLVAVRSGRMGGRAIVPFFSPLPMAETRFRTGWGAPVSVAVWRFLRETSALLFLSMCLLCCAGSSGRAPSSKTQTASHHRDYHQQLAAGTCCTFINFMCYVEGNPLIMTNFLCYMDSPPLMITNN